MRRDWAAILMGWLVILLVCLVVWIVAIYTIQHFVRKYW